MNNLIRSLDSFNRPWSISKAGLKSVQDAFKTAAEKLGVTKSGFMEELSSMCEPPEMEITGDGVAIIEVNGPLCNNPGILEMLCGMYSYEWLEDQLEEAMEANVRGIWLELDSPGGVCEGMIECGDQIAAIARDIPVVCYSDAMACSAAYSLAANCTKIYGSVGSTWGSVGTIVNFYDESAMYAAQGIKWDPIVNAEGVAKGALMGPNLTAAQRKSIQQLVQDTFNQFRDTILRSRNVPDMAMDGSAFLAPRALGYNLIDGILTEEDAMAKLVSLL